MCTTDDIQVTMGRDDLYAALRKVEPVLGDRPERRYLRIDSERGLAVSATDHEQLITAYAAADVERAGTVVVFGRFLIEFVRHAPSGKVVLRTIGSELQVEAGGSQIALACYQTEVWPNFEHLRQGGALWTRDALAGLRRVLPAVGSDPARPVLQGVSFKDGWAVATDTHQLAAVELELPGEFEALVPGSALETMLRAMSDDDVTVRFGEQRVSFIGPKVRLTTTLIVGAFPAWRTAVPDTTGSYIQADRRELLAALERVAFMVHKEDRCALHISAESGGLLLQAALPDIGHQEDHVGGENTVGTVCLQARNLKNLMEQLRDDVVTIWMDSSRSPALVREKGYVGLLMPIVR